MSRGTERRSIRVDGDLWAAAQDLAGRNGVNVSEIIRAALVAYVDAGELDDRARLVAEQLQVTA